MGGQGELLLDGSEEWERTIVKLEPAVLKSSTTAVRFP